MTPIVTVTFSPCIDKSTFVTAMVPEKKLMCAAPRLEPGGGGINVARAINKLEAPQRPFFLPVDIQVNFSINYLLPKKCLRL
jgi:6-phosphofructokinase 2